MEAGLETRVRKLRDEVSHHLHYELLPFWAVRGVDKENGGFLTYLDRDGNPMDEDFWITEALDDQTGGFLAEKDEDGQPTGRPLKTVLNQLRMIYTSSSIVRAGLDEYCTFREQAKQGFDFLLQHLWDNEHGGWYFTSKLDGTPVDMSKIGYVQDFGIYALSEYFMATGDKRGIDWAEKTLETMDEMAKDPANPGYVEICRRNWQTKRERGNKDPEMDRTGGQRKGFDIHMHLMEALTNLAEAAKGTSDYCIYRAKTIEIIGLLLDKTLDERSGLPYEQFTFGWKRLPRIIFNGKDAEEGGGDVWGSDRPETRPLDNTSYGHNVEFAWLLHRAIDVLGLDLEHYKPVMEKMYAHCVSYGIAENGGVYVDGAHDGRPRERNKEFWQQAECMTGMLDAYELTGDEKYLAAYENIHRFVFDNMINHDVGEWLPAFTPDNHRFRDENGRVRDYMGHGWKDGYHTVRAVIQCEQRLNRILEGIKQ